MESYFEKKPGLSLENIKEHIGKENIEFVEMKDLLKDTAENCVDGRMDHGAIGVPGRNAGELVLALAAFEKTSGKELELDKIDEILEKYIEVSGKFYMHTDEHALESCGLAENDLKNPGEKRDEILEKLTDPNHMGCGHLKLIIKNPEAYGVRSDLAKSIVSSIIRRFWNQDSNIDIEVLKGNHEEGAVVLVEVLGEVNESTMIPTVSPNVDGEEMFVYHPQVAEFMRRAIGEKINEIVGSEKVDKEEYLSQVFSLGQKQLGETVGRLASGLPVYHAVFKDGILKEVKE